MDELIGYTTLFAGDTHVPSGWKKEAEGVKSVNGALVSYYTKTESSNHGDEPFLGQIVLYSDYIPSGWLACDGKIMHKDGSTLALAEVLGTRFGGAGLYFALPDLPKVGGAQYIICVRGWFPG